MGRFLKDLRGGFDMEWTSCGESRSSGMLFGLGSLPVTY
jgi:hypothetical protein